MPPKKCNSSHCAVQGGTEADFHSFLFFITNRTQRGGGETQIKNDIQTEAKQTRLRYTMMESRQTIEHKAGYLSFELKYKTPDKDNISSLARRAHTPSQHERPSPSVASGGR